MHFAEGYVCFDWDSSFHHLPMSAIKCKIQLSAKGRDSIFCKCTVHFGYSYLEGFLWICLKF